MAIPQAGEASGVIQWVQDILAELESAAQVAAEADAAVEAVTEIGAVGVASATVAGTSEVWLPIVAIAIFCLILIFALGDLFLRPLGDLLSHVPIVGGALQAVCYDAQLGIATIINATIGWAFRTTFSLLHFLWFVSFGVLYATAENLRRLANYVRWVVSELLPSIIAALQGEITQSQTNSENHANDLYNSAVSQINADFTATENHTNDLYNQAVTQIQAAEAQASNHANDLYNQVEVDLASLHNQVEVDIAALHDEVQVELKQLQQQEQAYTDNAVGTATQGLEDAIGAAATAAAAAAAAVAQRLQKYLDNCGNDMCQANGQNAKNVNQLAKDIEAGAILAFLVAAIEEPVPTANAVDEVLGGTVSLFGQALDGLLGAAVA